MLYNKLKYIVLLHIVIIWFFPYLPLNDLPNHLATINIIDQIFHGDSYLSNIFEVDLFKPAIIPHIMILILSQFFPILISTKIFFTLYILLFFFAIDYSFTSLLGKEKSIYLIPIALLLIFNFFVYLGFLGFFLSVPIFLIFFTYWYKNKSNHLFLFFSLLILPFFHLFTTLLFLLSVVFFNLKYLKDPKFYLSLIPFLILFLFWTFGTSFTEGSIWDEFFSDFFSYVELVKYFSTKLLSFFIISPLTISLIIIFLIYLHLSKYKFNLKDKFLKFSIILFLIYLIFPETVPQWDLISIRFLLFMFFFLLLSFPKISKADLKLSLVIILSFHLFLLLFNLYLFHDYNQGIDDFIALSEHIEPESSIQFVYTPSRLNLTLSGTSKFLHTHHYITLFVPSTYGQDLFTYWYNPIKSKEPLLSDSYYFIIHVRPKGKVVDFNNCGNYEKYYDDLVSDDLYPQYDYLLIFKNECNVLNYFSKDYKFIHQEGTLMLFKLKK